MSLRILKSLHKIYNPIDSSIEKIVYAMGEISVHISGGSLVCFIRKLDLAGNATLVFDDMVDFSYLASGTSINLIWRVNEVDERVHNFSYAPS